MVRVSVTLATAISLTACAADPAASRPRLDPSAAGVTPQTVAESFEGAFTSAEAIHVRRRSFENGRPRLEAESWMTRDAVRTDIYERGARVYSLSIRGIHAQEYIPAGASADGVRGPRFAEYQLPSPHWIDSPRLVSVGWACSVGDQFGSLLAPDRRILSVFIPRLPTCTLLGMAQVQQTECAVLEWEDSPHDPDDPASFRQGAVYYIDMNRGWLLRTDQYQQERGRRIERVSLYVISPADPAPALFELPRN